MRFGELLAQFGVTNETAPLKNPLSYSSQLQNGCHRDSEFEQWYSYQSYACWRNSECSWQNLVPAANHGATATTANGHARRPRSDQSHHRWRARSPDRHDS